MRIATMALLVFAEDEPLAQWARERAHIFAERHASRVIVLNAASAENPPAADIEEWVEIGVHDSPPGRVHALAAAMLPAGVPRVLLWVAPRTGSDDRFAMLATEVRTILLDSSRARDDAAALADLVSYLSQDPHVPGIHDLAYLRLAPWQEIVADFFDEKSFIDDLFELQQVTVTTGSEAEAYYLLGWLASRLEWEPGKAGRFRHARNGHEIRYTIEREGKARRVRCITLESRSTRFRACLCDPDAGAVSLEVSGKKERPKRVAPLHDVDIASLIERAILHEHPDPVFHDSLEVAGKLLSA
jgi:glucose-6-phosphate dehydrogenase assembly protein OpcA